MTLPGLTCVACDKALNISPVRATPNGYRHVRCPRPTCDIEGCEKIRWARGWCNSHWRAWNRHGHPLISSHIQLEDVEWMAETGESVEGAATRLGVTVKSLERFLDRHKRRDLIAVMCGRQVMAA